MPCFYCGVKLRRSGPAMRTRDHVVPKSIGGYKTVESCVKCNSAKSDMSLEAFRIKCGGIEFWSERQERLARMETAWIHSFDAKNPVEKKAVFAQEHNRPTYTAIFDLSKITNYTRGAITKQEKKGKPHDEQERNLSTSHIPPDLLGVKFGLLTVVRRITGKWEVKCACGTIENRSSKSVINPANTFDACVECRKPLGELRSRTYRETGVQLSWEECFQQLYGEKEEVDAPSQNEHKRAGV